MRALHRRRGDVIACQGSSGQAVDRHKKAIFGKHTPRFRGLVRLADHPALLRGQAQIKHLPGARAVGRLKTQGHDPLFHAIQQLLRHDIDAALAVLQTNGRDIVAADAAVEA